MENLEPAAVWHIFESITAIPRPSKREEKIARWVVEFARGRGLECETDGAGNVLVRKPATAGMEHRPGVVLQSHMDMVCEKNAGVEFDFGRDPIRVMVTPDGWVKADGTTLGADCGIGMAAALAVLAADDVAHPAVEALFTVDEETGLTGAFALPEGWLKGEMLINLDSEDEGEIFIGCAGGVDTVATFRMERVAVPAGYRFYRLSVGGLIGGHSGDDIHRGRANAVRLAARWLARLKQAVPLALASFEGGNLRNAIPREAEAVFGVPERSAAVAEGLFAGFAADIAREYAYTDNGISLSLEPAAQPAAVMARGVVLVDALNGVPNGVQAMSGAMPGLVETSTNLASVKPGDGDAVVVTSSQRSSFDSAKRAVAASVRSVCELAGAEVAHSDGYPGWNPDPSSPLLQVAVRKYAELFGMEPKVRSIHAGLECGLFLEKYPGLDMISIGPTIRNVHSPDERLEISTVDRFWRHLTAILAAL